MKKIFLNLFYVILLSSALFSACDEIEAPYIIDNNDADTIKFPVPEFPVKSEFVKKVLVEEFTGHKCGNCPRAAEELVRMEEKYHEQIVPLAIHITDFFGGADETGYFTNDYKTPAGNAINDFFGIEAAGLPKGMVNRSEHEAQKVLNFANWDGAIAAQLAIAQSVDIQIITQYDKVSNEFAAHVQTLMLEDFSSVLNLSVYLIEDNIVSAQKDYSLDPNIVEDYNHRHMLRESLNGTWGEQLFEAYANIGDKILKSYSTTFNEAYNNDSCYIVAFVYDFNTKEVLQAEVVKILQN